MFPDFGWLVTNSFVSSTFWIAEVNGASLSSTQKLLVELIHYSVVGAINPGGVSTPVVGGASERNTLVSTSTGTSMESVE